METLTKPNIKDVAILFEVPQGNKILINKIIEIGGKRYLDMRSYYVDEKGDKVPTSRGIRLSKNDLDQFYMQGLFDRDFFRMARKIIRGGDAIVRAQ